MAMQNIAKVALLREALRNGPCTSAELNALTGVRIALIGALLGRDIRRGTVVRGTMNKHRVYGLAGSIEPQFLKKEKLCQHAITPAPSRADFPSITRYAAELERRKQFIQAHRVWLSASSMARTHENRNWCEVRAQVCSNSMRGV
ncbi:MULTISPECIES: ANR family transcriptional regulator [Brenneria]|uniref:ANR family transcriptional regulator n=1 Tax=Brenneria nigrifluens DSM 30175 = ATCC 13028 TaxID=1121120 RepID=A0A2U1USQ0_9GAMM|nr:MULTISPECIES: ANR family transcriptional regulator [Brenneria]EHD21526.1 hypothetical protein BrE312_2143 [Brenneria sp. EniD312]PWC24687.1 hypothetical protein DDT54_08345 [Brenneria nigrifluens DSM 30175 = ATCC 13028]QCR04648.1 ANR family transcriptional regulator [Brenneria nigrifluens DSM 30175 = ATCC 13028]